MAIPYELIEEVKKEIGCEYAEKAIKVIKNDFANSIKLGGDFLIKAHNARKSFLNVWNNKSGAFRSRQLWRIHHHQMTFVNSAFYNWSQSSDVIMSGRQLFQLHNRIIAEITQVKKLDTQF